MKHFNWMVFEHIDKRGIWFRGTLDERTYVLWWNPLKIIRAFLRGTFSFGMFPMSIKHIKW